MWAEFHFTTDHELEECDFFLPGESVENETRVWCRSGHAVLITAEPPNIRRYDRRYLAQFSAVVSPDPTLVHPSLRVCHQGLPWHAYWNEVHSPTWWRIALQDYDSLSAMPPLLKTRQISVICSSKTIIQGHRDRLEFVEALKSEFGDQLDWFGSGVRPIANKWDALAPYRYHITLENCQVPHYWSEKLADAYLGWCLPIYCGCVNLHEYFESSSYERIDVANIPGSIAKVRAILDEDPYDQRVAAIRMARQLILNDYNYFNLASSVLRSLPPREARWVTIQPEHYFTDSLWRKSRRAVKRLLAAR